jgi:hypothetical protein
MNYHPKLAHDSRFTDYVLFHEYFHGDTGRGVGASHQTGWTGLVAKLLTPRRNKPEQGASITTHCGVERRETVDATNIQSFAFRS